MLGFRLLTAAVKLACRRWLIGQRPCYDVTELRKSTPEDDASISARSGSACKWISEIYFVYTISKKMRRSVSSIRVSNRLAVATSFPSSHNRELRASNIRLSSRNSASMSRGSTYSSSLSLRRCRRNVPDGHRAREGSPESASAHVPMKVLDFK